MTSRAQKILSGQSVELERYQKSVGQMLIEVPFIALSATLLSVIPGLAISASFGSGIGYLFCAPISIWVFCRLLKEEWSNIGERIVCIDPKTKVLVVKQRFPHQPQLLDESIPFRDLLLLRFWRAESENESAAFIIRIQLSKNVFRPDIAGYLLHLEPVMDTALNAEEATAKLAKQLVAATDLEYFDIQGSKDQRFAPWSNPSIELTCPSEPGHAAHVKR